MATLYDSVLQNAGWANVPRGILRIEGADALKWLHKIVTADIEHLRTGQGTRSALLNAKGHFVADFVLLRDGEALGILVESSASESLLHALRQYVIREKVTVTDVSERWYALTIVGAHAAALLERTLETRAPEGMNNWVWGHVNVTAARVVRSARARVPAYDVILPLSGVPDLRAAWKDVPQIADELLETLRIEAGLPRWAIDFDESTLALEIPNVMHIRVDQGCYVGQEVVARIVHRGHVNRHLRGLIVESDSPPPRGQVIQFDGLDVGAITSSARSPLFGNIALGYVRRHVDPGARVLLHRTPARVVELPFPLI